MSSRLTIPSSPRGLLRSFALDDAAANAQTFAANSVAVLSLATSWRPSNRGETPRFFTVGRHDPVEDRIPTAAQRMRETTGRFLDVPSDQFRAEKYPFCAATNLRRRAPRQNRFEIPEAHALTLERARILQAQNRWTGGSAQPVYSPPHSPNVPERADTPHPIPPTTSTPFRAADFPKPFLLSPLLPLVSNFSTPKKAGDLAADDDDDDSDIQEIFIFRGDKASETQSNDDSVIILSPSEVETGLKEVPVDEGSLDSSLCVLSHRIVNVCPITKKPFNFAKKNPSCGHIYEAEAIFSLIRADCKKGRLRTRCPVAGCASFLTFNTLVKA